MVRGLFVWAALALGCAKASKPVPEGQALTPGAANSLRAIAPDCRITRTPDDERRDCRGQRGTVTITLGAQDRLRTIEIRLVSMPLFQARGFFVSALTGVLGARGVEVVVEHLDKLVTAGRADVTVDKARVAITATGTSRIALEYSAVLEW